MVGLDADHREVRLGVGAHELPAILALVRETDHDLIGAFDHVEVREHETALVEDHARTQSPLAELAASARTIGAEELLEEFLEERIVGSRLRAGGAGTAGLLDRIEIDHGGPDVLGDADETRLEAIRQAPARRGGGRGPATLDRGCPGPTTDIARAGSSDHEQDNERSREDGGFHEGSGQRILGIAQEACQGWHRHRQGPNSRSPQSEGFDEIGGPCAFEEGSSVLCKALMQIN